MPRPDLEYVLPLRWHDDAGLADLTAYLAELAASVDVTVVDDSAGDLFERHHGAWGPPVRHLRPEPWPGRNGKVRNVMTGVRRARHAVVLVVRRENLARGGYDGDVLFENLELMRTVAAGGGRVRREPGRYVGRRAPVPGHFWSQRVRQAYDDFAQPLRLAGGVRYGDGRILRAATSYGGRRDV